MKIIYDIQTIRQCTCLWSTYIDTRKTKILGHQRYRFIVIIQLLFPREVTELLPQ